jgi:hypothetical protein
LALEAVLLEALSPAERASLETIIAKLNRQASLLDGIPNSLVGHLAPKLGKRQRP